MHLRILTRPHPPDLMVHLPHDPQSPQSPSPSEIGQMYWWGITLLLRKKKAAEEGVKDNEDNGEVTEAK